MTDILNTIVVNPIKKIGSVFTRSSSSKTETVEKVIIKHEYEKMPVLGFKSLAKSSRIFLRLAALSGAAAVVASAYGSHVFNKRQETTKDMRELYFTAQYYHLVHSVALLGVPFVSRPKITGVLLSSGIVLFCGTMYYHALTKDNRLRFLTPYGGFCLIAGWLSILF
ncbi:transmembrane protein -like [Brachionus plicatilis]|uniref:Transmembrane protein-like n=1 Tax=Brachionus plicatilis TaxID=10195 RepID=A0A3M7QRD4_BRAPC|nr:transmembrane protein -like [Brachionus plicatilis]RNA14410.1 transmembrane protein -like [Brachionus plicatilis]